MNLEEIHSARKNNPQSALIRLKNQYEELKTKGQQICATTKIIDLEYSSELSPLSGSSFSVKDNIGVRGISTSWGITPPAKAAPDEDSEIVAKLRKLGSSLTAISNLDEFALGVAGKNRFFGDILNPFSPEYAIGGSSGGAAALVAANLCDFSVCSDIGGSARIPAAILKLFGMKFSSKDFSKKNSLLLDDPLDAFGLICRTHDDLKYLLLNLFQNTDAKIFSLVIPHVSQLAICSDDMQDAFQKLIAALKNSAIAEIFEYRLPFDQSNRIRKIITARAFANKIQSLKISWDLMSQEAKALLLLAKEISTEEFCWAQSERDRIRAKLNDILSDNVAILTPSLPFTGWDRRSLEDAGGQNINHFLTLANVGDLFALTFPVSAVNNSAFQLIGRPGSEIQIGKFAKIINELGLLN